MSVGARLRAWAAANFAPLVLIPFGALLLWAALWRVWLPPVGNAGAVSRVVTTVNANAGTRPTHRVTTIVRESRGEAPSRRSELLALALVFLAAGAAVIAVFQRRIGSLELGKDGLKIDLTPAEAHGASALVGALARSGSPARAYSRGLDRYLREVAAHRDTGVAGASRAGPAGRPRTRAGLSAGEAESLGARIAGELG